MLDAAERARHTLPASYVEMARALYDSTVHDDEQVLDSAHAILAMLPAAAALQRSVLSTSHLMRNHLREAHDAAHQALAAHGSIADTRGLVATYHNLAVADLALAGPQTAERWVAALNQQRRHYEQQSRIPFTGNENNITSQIEQEIEVNFTSVVRLTQHCLSLLLRRNTSAIVNVGSGTGLVPKPDGIVYSATKAAVHSFTKGLRWQLEGTGVNVFELFPPVVETAMTAGRAEQKVTPETVAQALITGMQRDQAEIYVGKIKLLQLINRLLPALAEKIMRR
ncbi:MAG: SDR family NAD(P)-dependent oxidoreductase [Caldilineaceae bacterium]